MPRKPKTRAPYRMVSPPTWELARAAYLGGMTAQQVAGRFDIGVHNLRQTIKRRGWSKRGLADARAQARDEFVPAEAPRPATPDAAVEADLFEAVLGRARAALTAGRGGEASALLKATREFVIVQQDVVDARATHAGDIEIWDTARPDLAGAVTEQLVIQTLHSRWSGLSDEELAFRADPDGALGLAALRKPVDPGQRRGSRKTRR